MEVYGTLTRRVPYISAGGGTYDSRYCCSSSSLTKPSSVSLGGSLGFMARQRKLSAGSGFRDIGHVEYYQKAKIRCDGGNKVDKKKTTASMSTKKKLKVLKGLTEGLSMVSDLGIALDSESSSFIDQIRGQVNLEASEVLLKRLEQLREEEKELKIQKKQEKVKLKASKMKSNRGCESSSSSSSESSDDECDEVVDMNFMRQLSVSVAAQSTTLKDTSPDAPVSTVLALPGSLTLEKNTTRGINFEDHIRPEVGSYSRMNGVGSVQNVSSKMIEVCMGNKCKKAGSAALLEEFGRAMGDEGSVLGCKCMGKCRNGPNVRILNSIDGSVAEGANDSVRSPVNPLCMGVGLEDVNVILSNYFGKEQKDLGLV